MINPVAGRRPGADYDRAHPAGWTPRRPKRSPPGRGWPTVSLESWIARRIGGHRGPGLRFQSPARCARLWCSAISACGGGPDHGNSRLG
ncbi:MAG: hypothetical protein WKF75_02725 [Singulisphaera sp.]